MALLAVPSAPKSICPPSQLTLLRQGRASPLSAGRPRLLPVLKRCPAGSSARVHAETKSGGAGQHAIVQADEVINYNGGTGRRTFPDGFIFGAGSSAYQIEGAYNEDGKGESIWDVFTRDFPDKTEHSDGKVADDSYHRYKEDVKALKDMGVDAYRFSISWSRILPKGSGDINQAGIDHYHKLLDELHNNGITPYVTLFHWDLPQALEDYGGFRNDKKIVEDFTNYCDLCFKEYGTKVKYWFTVNEPSNFSINGYRTGSDAPGRCSDRSSCPAGDGQTEPYIVAHNMLKAHAAAYHLYKDKYQKDQPQGQIGITLSAMWTVPYSDTKPDREAAQRQLDFSFGWFMDPLVYGDYPFAMKTLVGDRLPPFKEEESKKLKGSYDFIALNYYTARYAKDAPTSDDDSRVQVLEMKNSIPIGEQTPAPWLLIYPEGIKELLEYTKEQYSSPSIYVTENGVCEANVETDQPNVPKEDNDQKRIIYLVEHLDQVREAIESGVDVKGYFVWSLLDSFEWNSGYTLRFGLYFCRSKGPDGKIDLNRYPKASSKWFTDYLKRNTAN